MQLNLTIRYTTVATCTCVHVQYVVVEVHIFLAQTWRISVFTPHACARGKAIGLSVVVVVVVVIVVVGTKITRSRVLGICASSKHNQSVDIGEKLVYTRFELLKKAY